MSAKPEATGAEAAEQVRLGAGELDELDAAIIEQLQRDGRRPYRAIARELAVPEGTVRFRVNRLVREGVVHLTATVHPQRLGGLLATLLLRVAPPDREAAIDELRRWPEVIYLSSCTGRADLMLQVVASDMPDLNALLTDRLGAVAGVVEVETVIELEVLKSHYAFPPSSASV